MTSTSDQILQAGPLQPGSNIVLLTASLAYGGAEIVVVDLAKGLQKRGWRTSVVTMLPPQAFVEDLEQLGIEVVSLDMHPGSLSPWPFFKFHNYLRRTRPALVHAQMFHASMLARLMKLMGGPPCICTVQNTNEGSQRTGKAALRENVFRWTNFASDRNTGVSELVKERYTRERIVPRNGMEVIQNGVDVARFTPPSPEHLKQLRRNLEWEGNFVWLAAARLVIAKDYPNLIEAFRSVHARFPNARLAIAGDGILRDEIQNHVQRAGLCGAVSLLGLRTDMPHLMRACDALVVSSAWEGGPLVLMEAGACEKPVVTTNVGAAAEIVAEGQTGFVVPVRKPAALAEAMATVISLDPIARARMGALARKRIVDRFSLETIHGQYVKLYERVLAEAR